MGIPRGTTPTFTFTFPNNSGIDLREAHNVYVTFQSGTNASFTKTGSDLVITELSVSVYMAQEETLGFRDGTVYAQVNWTMEDGSRFASEVVNISFTKQLLQAVVE